MSFEASPEASSDEERQDQVDEPVDEGEDDDNADEEEAEGSGDDEEEGDGENEEDRTMASERLNGKAGSAGAAARSDTANEASDSKQRPAVTLTSPSPQATSTATATRSALHPAVRPEAITAMVYDIVPTIAAPQSTSINTVTATPDLRWAFSGGSDGYIRKFNWVDTANGKLMLTVAQRHPFVDSVTKAGVLVSYWENEDPYAKPNEEGQTLSPVYSLAVHSQALWLLSGVESGAINLQSVRHDEGKRIHCLKQHTSAVSVLKLAHDEKSVLSGSWDRTVLDWDLNTGQVTRTFDGTGGQISALEVRPMSSLPVPEQSSEAKLASDTFASNGASQPLPGSDDAAELFGPNGIDALDMEAAEAGPLVGSPTGSLFGEGGDHDSLFGDAQDGGPDPASAGPAPTFGADPADDDEFSRAIADGFTQQPDAGVDGAGDIQMGGTDENGPDPFAIGGPSASDADADLFGRSVLDPPAPSDVGPTSLPHAEDTERPAPKRSESDADAPPSEGTVFLAASFDGTLRVWDKRRAAAVARIPLPRGAPPWCMGACWAPDGNAIYAGRRNGTLEEYSLHKGLREPDRVFRFPNGSGPVSAVRAMPNGRHLICASYDILRLYDLQHQPTKSSSVPFLIVPGHRTGVISQLYLDPTCRFMISTAGNRGWEGNSTQVLLGYEINI